MSTSQPTSNVTLRREHYTTAMTALADQLQDELEQAIEQLGRFNDQLAPRDPDNEKLWIETVDLMTVLRFAHNTGDVMLELVRGQIRAR